MNTAIAKPRHNEGWMNFAFARTLAANTMSSNESNRSDSGLTREQILRALESLSDKLRDQNIIGELCLFGGTVMVLAYNARLNTKDVDAVFQPSAAIRDFARATAEELDLPQHWLNDGVKGFVSARHDLTTGDLPQFSHLRLTMPVPEYLLAMKCMAARIGGPSGEASDVPDILFLIKHLNFKSFDEVLRIVGEYYPTNQIPVKTQFLVESLFQEGHV
jgi:hypothetical protein